MPRILCIDYGLKRTGIAVTDPMQIIATGLTTVETNKLTVFLKDYCAKEEVELFLVGEPRGLDDQDTHASEPVRKFIAWLKRHFPKTKIETIDERYTSKMASRAMIEMGMKKKDRQRKGAIDEIAATMMLQEWMERRGS
ncbi:MAG: Holliday junction resolvase RuvX [Chitinophagaceae bacterium]|jgi:putative Holliday junction resolvase|nr:Holliday junction resolvase RuvX [Chitinophagaceae bacterium]